ncbi:hypothetical protein SHELI_v1c06220 [Spiroplasma helicoides]|uniref:Transmembrane protein n=1 Tax=Spiroplasma helicoides TaxID=216938 RepID=A0A1B3SKX7_9MOLU|nr:hypothetical protein [Spiroplasma helicoides]AOG60573.1 hypothetical protein SHELI_v1c06220 [Spiroplasma helicoides]
MSNFRRRMATTWNLIISAVVAMILTLSFYFLETRTGYTEIFGILYITWDAIFLIILTFFHKLSKGFKYTLYIIFFAYPNFMFCLSYISINIFTIRRAGPDYVATIEYIQFVVLSIWVLYLVFNFISVILASTVNEPRWWTLILLVDFGPGGEYKRRERVDQYLESK